MAARQAYIGENDAVEYLLPTGIYSADTANLAAAIARIDAANKGHIQLVDTGLTLAVNLPTYFGDVSLYGHDRATITLADNATLIWGEQVNPLSLGTSFSGLAAQVSEISIPVGLTLVRGDYVCLRSSDSLNSLVSPHVVGGSTRPGGIYKVIEVSGGVAYLDGVGIDDYVTSPMVWKLNAHHNVAVENFTLLPGSPSPAAQSISIAQCVNGVLQGVKNRGCGQIQIAHSHNFRMVDVLTDHMASNFGDYGMLVNNCTLIDIDRCVFHQCRHSVTTGGYDDGANNRYSNSRELRITNCKANGIGTTDSVIAFDTHPEGYEITFDNCEVNCARAPSTTTFYAFSNRSRRTRYSRCRVIGMFGNSNSSGFRVWGPDTFIDGCEVNGGWLGVELHQVASGTKRCDNLTIQNCKFTNVKHPVTIYSGVGHKILNNDFKSSGNLVNNSPDIPKVKIFFGEEDNEALGGTAVADRIQIRGNDFCKDVVDWSIHTDSLTPGKMAIAGNFFGGYGAGAGSLGILWYRRWKATTAYSLNAKVRVAGGVILIATTGGTSGSSEPTGAGTDGSVTWAVSAWDSADDPGFQAAFAAKNETD